MLYKISLLSNKQKISLLGAFFGVMGSFIMVMDYFAPFSWVADRFSPWKDLRDAQIIMSQNSFIQEGQAGFSELKALIKDRSDLPTYGLVRVVKASAMSVTIGNNQASVPLYTYHALYSDGRSVGLGDEGTIRNWIKTYRDRSFIFWGLLFLVIGFVLSAWSHFADET
ncbi:hypothetical protein AB1K40_17120 [Vibrio cholerae]|uniref:hypothetical protein n=1 Tax=Vibrio cholerae TaxID=666 RepID=UPI002A5213AC|nr:hypothetical protein [Vibrio cholerae]ELZ1193302.1 hypothetical protein [Vibrio cholerae]HDL9509988.1 hypothetical protein [Vibrio cholerae]